MCDAEAKALANQLGLCYGYNKRLERPLALAFAGLEQVGALTLTLTLTPSPTLALAHLEQASVPGDGTVTKTLSASSPCAAAASTSAGRPRSPPSLT